MRTSINMYKLKINTVHREAINIAICRTPYNSRIHTPKLEKMLQSSSSEITLTEMQLSMVLRHLQRFIEEQESEIEDWTLVNKYKIARDEIINQIKAQYNLKPNNIPLFSAVINKFVVFLAPTMLTLVFFVTTCL